MKLTALWKRGLAGILTAAFVITGLPYIASAADMNTEDVTSETDFKASNPASYTTIEFDKEYSGMAGWDQTDAASYIFKVDKPGRLTLTTHSKGGMYYTIMDNDSLYSDSTCKIYWKNGGSSLTISGDNVNTIDLIPGQYYMYITGYPRDEDKEDAKYSFTMSFLSVDKTPGYRGDEEILFDSVLGGSNNEQETATTIKVGNRYRAFISEDTSNKEDWFKFTLEKPATLYLAASTRQLNTGDFRLVYGTQELGLKGEYPVFTNKKGLVGYEITVMYAPWNNNKPSSKLPEGTYYLKLRQDTSRGTGSYTFELAKKAQTPMRKLNVRPQKTKVKVGATKKLKVTVAPKTAAYDNDVLFESSDTNIATVNDEGIVTGVSEGIATIKVTTYSPDKKGKQITDECKVTVTK